MMNHVILLKSAALALTVGISAFAQAAEIAVGFREAKSIGVAEGGGASQTDPVSVSSDGRLYKTGGGVLTMPTGVLGSRIPSSVTVLEGTLALTANPVAPSVEPPAVIVEKAAFWTDASDGQGLVTTGEGEDLRASRWCDRRETNRETPTMWYAEAAWANPVTPQKPLWNIPPAVKTVDGRRVVYFGGTHSGQYMKFMKNGSASTLTDIYDYFIVMGVDKSYGCALGGTSDTKTPMFLTDLFSLGDERLKFLYFRGDLGVASFSAQHYLNGVRFDPYSTAPSRGFQLFENHCCGKVESAEACSFFQTYPGGARSEGGDYLCEVIVFTDVLSEAERLSVERYLMEKWDLTAQDGVSHVVETTAGTTVEVTAAADESVADVVVSGSGRLVKTGAGTLALQEPETPFAGTLSLESGAVGAKGGRVAVPSVELSAGQRLSVSEVAAADADPTTAAGQATATLTAAVTADAGAGTAVKLGTGPLAVRSVAADVATLQVKGGVLALDAGLVGSGEPATGADVSATILNADFEIPVEMSPSPSSVYENFKDLYAEYKWSRLSGGSNASYIFATDQGKYSHWSTWCAYPCPQGKQCLYLISDAGACTTVTFPRKGRYVFSFLASARSVAARPTLDLLLGKDETSLASFGVFAAATVPFVRYYYRTPLVEAGDYKIGFKSRQSADTGVTIDDLRCDLIAGDETESAAYAIPNGDFEKVNLGFYCNDPHANNTTEGWTIGTERDASALLAHLSTLGIRNGESRQFTLSSVVWGSTQLSLSCDGWATTTFTPPAGTYRLRGKVASFPNGTYTARSAGISAVVTIGGSETALGTVTTERHELGSFVWPTSFTVDGETPVTLKVIQTASGAHAVVDDFDLVGVETDGELLTDGGFEDWRNPKWVSLDPAPTKYPNTVASYHGYTGFEGSIPYEDIWGYNRYAGDTYLRICANGGVQQEIEFPESGIYRLVFRARSRLGTSCGGNPLSAWYRTLDGTKTNFLYRTASDYSTNFVEHVCTFTVTTPGRYVFALQGTGVDLATNPGEGKEVLVDGVSLKKADGARAQAPSVPSTLSVAVDKGAILHLGYAGNIRLEELRLGGRRVSGTITAERFPEFITGEGSVFVEPKGLSIILR